MEQWRASHEITGQLWDPREEAESCKFNETAVVSARGFSPAAALSSPGAVTELMPVGQKKVHGGGQAGAPLNPKTDSEKQNGTGAKRRGIKGLDPDKVLRGKSH